MSEDEATSFWALLEELTRESDEDIDERIWQHLPNVQRRIQHSRRCGYGVGYEWIFEPNKVDIEWPPSAVQTRYQGKHFWYGVDHLFRGIGQDEIENIMAQAETGVAVEEDNYLERVTRVQETIYDHNVVCGGIPSPEEMVGTYDVIFYAAEYKFILRHHRTSCGTLTLASEFDDQENGNKILRGTVKMDPKVCQDLDVVPFGGSFAFVETERYQRLVTPKHNDRSRSVHETPTVAGVIQIQVSEAPQGTFEMRYGRVTPNIFKGEFKQLKQKVALCLQRDCPMPWGDDDVPLRTTWVRDVEECMDQNKVRKECCLLWMRRLLEPSLPGEVLCRIQEFVSPPQFLILEEDDWVMGIVWSGGLPSFSANSCLVVRQRR